MVDVFTPAERSRVMAAVRSRGNVSTELVLAAALRRAGVTGWRRHATVLVQDTAGARRKVRPDFVFRQARVAVFVHGCFWHGCPKHATIPKTRRGFWQDKISRNRSRDLLVARLLRKAGWRVIRVWEHDTRLNAGSCARRIRLVVG